MKKAGALLVIAIFLAGARTPVQADQKAQDIMKQVAKATIAVRTLTADFSVSTTMGGKTTYLAGKMMVMKPLFLRQDFWPADSNGQPLQHTKRTPHEILASDGVSYWQVSPAGAMFKDRANTKNVGSDDSISTSDQSPGGFASMFFDSSGMDATSVPPNTRYAGTTRFDGLTCQALVDKEGSPGQPGSGSITIIIGPDYLLRSLTFDGGSEGRFEMQFHHVRTNVLLSKADFAFHPPSWAKLTKEPSSNEEASRPQPVLKMDAKSSALLQAASEKMKSIKSLTADYSNGLEISQPKSKGGRHHSDVRLGTAKLMKPNFSWVTYGSSYKGASGKIDTYSPEIHVSNGVTYWNLYDTKQKLYESHSVAADGHDIHLYDCRLLSDFFDPGNSRYATAGSGWDKASIKYGGPAVWQGEKYQTIVEHLIGTEEGITQDDTETLFIGEDSLIHRSISHIKFSDGDTMTEDDSISNLQIDAPLSKSDFAFALPAGATEKAQFDFSGTTARTPQLPLLANGTIAPDFTANDRNGKPIHLSDYKGRVVVLDFWATWCGPCQMALPGTNQVAQKYPKVVFLAVNVSDTQSAFNSWLPEHKNFSAMKFVIDPTPDQGKDVASSLYHVEVIPTQFVIDPTGKIVESFVGYDQDTSSLQKAIKAAGKG